MARFKLTMAYGNVKADIAAASYSTGDATANLELNVDAAKFTNSGDLVIALEHLKNKILDSDYPPA